MKYLKLFEDINTDGYEVITIYNKIDLLQLDNVESFNSNEFRIISENLKNCNRNLHIFLGESRYFGITDDMDVIVASNPDHYTQIGIFKLRDEWYLLDLYIYKLDSGYMSEYYKCDQLGGLINCIENLPK